MRHALGFLAIPFVLTPAFADSPRAPHTPGDAAALSERTALLAPIQVDSLTLTPIVATAAAPKDSKDDALLVLDEGMASKQVRIQEISADGNVNSLTFVNSADQPVFLLAGEVILGGKQDRIIGRNTVIPAKTTQAVPVYCVEHGRWDGKTKEFTSARALAHNRLRGRASYAAQREVWSEVSAKNAARKTKNASDTYRRVAQQQSDGTLGGMEKRITAALAQIAPTDRDRMVGFAVALNGAVATVDLFGSPALFRKLETKLVRSYLTEAVDLVANKDIKPPSAGDVKAFMADADKAAEQKSYDTEAAETVINAGARAYKAKVEYKRKPSAATPADAKPAPTVYQNYQAH
jgi:hypothetical protein